MNSQPTNFDSSTCVICRAKFKDSIDSDISEVSRGLERLLEYSEKHNDVELTQHLRTKPSFVKVHNSCRRSYTSKRRFDQKITKESVVSDIIAPPKTLRSSAPMFDWKTHCFFCSKVCVTDDGMKVRHVKTLEIEESVLEQCLLREDAWGLEVKSRLMTCHDLFAEEAVYHKNCHRNFYRRNMYASRGRPADSMKSETFEKLCEWLEVNDFELLTLQDVVNEARVLVPENDAVYCEQWMKTKLIARYGDHIQFNEVRGRRNVICWKEMASYIVNQKWHEEHKENQVEHIVVTAAKLLKATIREAQYQTASYPSCEEVRDPKRAKEWMPTLLQLFLDHLICPEGKKIAVGHSIVQAVRPRTAIAPIPFALGVSVDHVSASKFLIDLLHRLGMSVSYDEVCRFKQSVIRCESTDQTEAFPDCFTQYVADNVDHDVCTLDGSGTLHAMGIISITNFCSEDRSQLAVEVPVPRLKVLKSCDVAKLKRIPLLHCCLSDESVTGLTFERNFQSTLPSVLSPATFLDLLWHLGWFFRNDEELRPSWAGFNDSVVRGSAVRASVIRMQPLIDMNPNDVSCILSALVYIAGESKKLNIKTPTITFDLPLWFKAIKIVHALKLDIVCRLGAFHVQMSYLGSIGTLMAGSGLDSVMECCYGPNTVKHIFSGKAVARGVRAHFLIESALTVMLLKNVLSSGIHEKEISELRDFYNSIICNGYNINTVQFPLSFGCIENALNNLKSRLSNESRTAKLWIQYLSYVSTLKLLLRAERTADWQLHLLSIRQMVNLFAATGHNNYAKCARLYIEMMTNLPVTHPDLYQQFMSGNHVARRSNKVWSGLSTDLTIEQAMMRALKGRGGLTHGRGITESVRTTWVASVHKTAAVKTALTEFTDLEYCHDTVPHPELGKSRAKRDNDDIAKIIDFFELHNPFDTSDCRLRSLTSGITAADSDNINCDDAEKIGAGIMLKMDGVCIKDVKLKRCDHVRTLAHVTNVATASGKKHLNIDPTMLFNRLLIIMQRSTDMQPYFSHELSSLPTSLFKDNSLRKTNKSQLAKGLCEDIESSSVPESSVHVIDGGYLLHVVNWIEGASYADVAQQYVTYINKHYSHSAVIVFDGYCNGPSTKDQEHLRRSTKLAPDVVVEERKTAYRDQNAFLANERNKSAFVTKILVTFLQAAGHTVHQAPDDADTAIVKEALNLATAKKVVSVIANDTDILVMLVYHFRSDMSDIVMYSKTSQRIISVRAVASALGPSVVSRLLVIHALSGCDTTSCLFGHGKISAYKKLSKASGIEHLIDILESSSATHEEVTLAGCGLVALLYGGSVKDRLNHLRYSMYMHITATSTQLPRPERLPPTENAAKFHSYRVHLQILNWKLLSTTDVNPQEWGWKEHEQHYIPVATDIDIAPPDIMKVACCKCSSDSKKPCSTQACLCRKYGLSCVTACKNCNGISCENANDFSVDYATYNEDLDVDDTVVEAVVTEIVDDDIVDDEYVEFFMPWVMEEEVATSM